ncbi:Mini-ribonuclease 3 [Clostridium sp. 19966]|uniref:Mini-ribonuclease 3 n=1 Tax=Clostridium sp. 19966 TaxID=2768166 RepID=UPI0028DF7C13|nr:ribonuclease III domain-containing protein [Clostridium sp. 19966]MDT8715795.1 Mini-ribonuclease 3 [Clostridium sp. 19966]
MIFNYFEKKLTPQEARNMNPLSLAFIGDAVYEIMVREYLVIKNNNLSAHKLHLLAVSYVKAHSQNEIMKKLQDILSEEEQNIFKRGRNAKSPTVPKNANVSEYRGATGFEALIGYLYVIGNSDRLKEFMNIIFN